MGTQKIEMGRNRDTDYEMKKRAALAQSQENSYMQGVQTALGDGSLGDAIADTRDVRGNVLDAQSSLFKVVKATLQHTMCPVTPHLPIVMHVLES